MLAATNNSEHSGFDLDLVGKKIYWTDGTRIYRMNFDGSNQVIYSDDTISNVSFIASGI